LTTFQSYVAPGCDGTLAFNPVALCAADVGAVIVAIGCDARVTM